MAQAFALEGARSIITVNATRESGGKTASNMVWSYGHTTIPRHLRDIVISEYGVADLRGRTDRDCVAAMLAIADARFQGGLLAEARRAGKIEASFRVDGPANVPGRIADALAPARAKGWLPLYPFGTEFTAVEQRLIPALQRLKAISRAQVALARAAWRGWRLPPPDADENEALERMGLAVPARFSEHVYRALLRWALQAEGGGRQ